MGFSEGECQMWNQACRCRCLARKMRQEKNAGKASLDCEEHGKETSFRELMYHSSYKQAQLFELNNGDPLRNIIEMIVRKASTNPSKSAGKIKSVFRVKNPIETLRFEKVKKVAKERNMRHPSTVDGNELMRFYCTTNGLLCNGPTCRVFRQVKLSHRL